MKLSDISIHAFIQEYGIRTESGQPLEFHTHRYLFDIYRDKAPNLVLLKGAQLGLTTLQIIRSFYRAAKMGLDIIYVLPTFTDIKDFSAGKVNRIVDHNPIFQEWVKDKDSVEQKRVGGATIYYRGSWNERQALMVSADELILDEFDRSNQAVMEQYESRMQHSAHGYKSVFSNPSIPGTGVDVQYQRTDKKCWFVTHLCQKTFILDEKCINYDQKRYECPHCGGEITDEERRMGEWVATTEGEKGWSGYWIPLWINPRMSATRIAEYKSTKTPEYFANFVAGLPYVGGDDTIAPATVLKNVTSLVNDQSNRIIIGVDTGLPIHFVIGNKQGAFFYGTCSDASLGNPYADLEKYLQRWPSSILVADQGGDLIGIRQLQAKYPGRVFLCYYRKDKKAVRLIEWSDGTEFGKVVVDRNRMLSLIVEQLRDPGRLPLNGSLEDWEVFASHFGNIYREKIVAVEQRERDDRTLYGTEYVWKRNGPDHFVHSFLYMLVGLDKFGEQMATVVETGDIFAGILPGKVI